MAQSPIRPTDDEARSLARALLSSATHAALGFRDRDGAPSLARIGVALDPHGVPMALVSQLSAHTAALARDPAFALMVGEPGERGDPLTHPRLTLQGKAQLVSREAGAFAPLRAAFVAARPKARLYADFTDFLIARFTAEKGALIGGFGRAFHLTPADMGMPAPGTPARGEA